MKKIFLCVLLLSPALTNTARAELDAATSRVGILSKQMGVPVEGDFKRFSAHIEFDPARPAQSKARVEIDIASFDLGSEEFNRETRKPEWFDAAQFPRATFVSSALVPAGKDTFQAKGRLTLKGVTQDVVIPVRYHQEAGAQVFEGVLPIRRLQFNVGSGAWKDTSTVADEVDIRFRLVNRSK